MREGDQSSYGKNVVTTTPGGVFIYGCYVDMWNNRTLEFPTEYLLAIDTAGVTNEMSDYEKCVHINDYLCAAIDYGGPESTYKNMHIGLRAIQGGKGVCMDYAKAFQTMTSMLGIKSYTYSSDVLNHSWNAVVIDGTLYFIDTTWNDSLNNNKYLMSTELWADHNAVDIQITGATTKGWEEAVKRTERKEALYDYMLWNYELPYRYESPELQIEMMLKDEWICKELSEMGLTLVINKWDCVQFEYVGN